MARHFPFVARELKEESNTRPQDQLFTSLLSGVLVKEPSLGGGNIASRCNSRGNLARTTRSGGGYRTLLLARIHDDSEDDSDEGLNNEDRPSANRHMNTSRQLIPSRPLYASSCPVSSKSVAQTPSSLSQWRHHVSGADEDHNNHNGNRTPDMLKGRQVPEEANSDRNSPSQSHRAVLLNDGNNSTAASIALTGAAALANGLRIDRRDSILDNISLLQIASGNLSLLQAITVLEMMPAMAFPPSLSLRQTPLEALVDFGLRQRMLQKLTTAVPAVPSPLLSNLRFAATLIQSLQEVSPITTHHPADASRAETTVIVPSGTETGMHQQANESLQLLMESEGRAKQKEEHSAAHTRNEREMRQQHDQFVAELSKHDFLVGRNGCCQRNPGNQCVRDLVERLLPAYKRASTVRARIRLAERIVKHVHAKGGRFLEKKSKVLEGSTADFDGANSSIECDQEGTPRAAPLLDHGWCRVPKDECRQKMSQRFREEVRSRRSSFGKVSRRCRPPKASAREE